MRVPPLSLAAVIAALLANGQAQAEHPHHAEPLQQKIRALPAVPPTTEQVLQRLEQVYQTFLNAPPDRGPLGQRMSRRGMRFTPREIRLERAEMAAPQFAEMRAALIRNPRLAATVDEDFYRNLGAVLDLKRDIVLHRVAERRALRSGRPLPPEFTAQRKALEREYTSMRENTPMGDLHAVPGGLGEVYMTADAVFVRDLNRDALRDHNLGWLGRVPESPAAHRFSGDTFAQDGDYAAARDAYNAAISLDPGDAAALAGRAAANNQLGDYAAAARDAQAALALDPTNQSAFATLKMTEGRVGGDAGHAGHHVAHGGSHADHTRGFMGGGSRGGARVSFAAATRTSGQLAAGRSNEEAERALRLNDPSAALAHTARALENDGSNPHAHYLRSTALARLKRWREAAEAAEKAEALDPKSWQYAAARAYAQGRDKKYRDALASSNRALELKPDYAWAFGTRALANGGLGDRDAMAADLRRAAELNPAFRASLEQALQKPADEDLLFLFPGEADPRKTAPAAEAGRRRRFGVLAGAAAVGGLLLALGLLSAALGPVKDALTSAFTRGSRRSPSVSPLGREAADSAPRSGLLRGQYELGRRIGAGGMGLVYEGTDRSLGRRVAIKRMRDEIRLDPRERARFVSEARTVAALHHPNIVDIYAVVEEADELHLVFEFVEGRTLHEIVSQKGGLAPADASRVVRAAADALDFAHGRGVIHRDMKPSNLMIDAEGRVKVMDFGIARAAKDAMTRASMTNTVAGTPPYMAPEQEQGQVRKESDVYALAVCAYELLVGTLPFPGIAAGMLMNKINMSYVPPSKMSESLPPALDAVFEKAFQPDPEKRYRRAGEFAAAFEAGLAQPAKA